MKKFKVGENDATRVSRVVIRRSDPGLRDDFPIGASLDLCQTSDSQIALHFGVFSPNFSVQSLLKANDDSTDSNPFLSLDSLNAITQQTHSYAKPITLCYGFCEHPMIALIFT